MMNTQTESLTFDVVIVGGGMVGSSLALLLESYLEKGLSVALVDANGIESSQNVNAMQPSFDDRTTAISLGSKRILDDLNAWPAMSQSATAIKHIQVSQQKQFGRVRLAAKDSQVEAFGYVVENRMIGHGLQQALLRLRNTHSAKFSIIAPAHVETYAMDENGAQLTIRFDNHQLKVQTQLLVLADGANSEGCKQLGIEQVRHDYQQQAIVCNVSFDQAHENWAYERFTQDGPLALLPMSNNRFALVWCMQTAQAEQRLQKDAETFKQELQSVIGFDKGRISQIGERFSYPLSLVQSQEQVRSHLVVLGNAAHALHPVAGQGFNLALRDAKSLAKQISKQLDQPGNLSGLQQYFYSQQQDQQLTTGISHALPTNFSQPGLHWSLLRGLSMSLMDVTPVAKQLFANQAMGLVASSDPWRP